MPSKHLSNRYKPSVHSSSVPETTPRTPLSVSLHLVGLAILSNAFRLLWTPSPVKEYMDGQFGGQWNFLTVLSLAVSWLTFAVAVLKDVLPSVRLFDRLKTTLMIVAVPVEGLVSLLYWGMQVGCPPNSFLLRAQVPTLTLIRTYKQFYDPSLLTPKGAIFKIPLFLDISIHAFPALLLWIDFLVFSPPMSKKANPLLISTVATMGYTTWMEYTNYHNQWFPYPFLSESSEENAVAGKDQLMKSFLRGNFTGELTRFHRASFYIAMIPVLLGLFYLANGIHRSVRGRPAGVESKTAKRLDRKVQKAL
ncbi:BQ5605_C001g00895 [Microbotryum silenes-dioicae]|uniref:BQ5605_C001g00895 protein n=1 Tax=Microbotryum silenes-dioicae TaxID=796604 RepID=A0A2X0P735_9BASI|nr:BQ5605_C001g00895 [Microbotryum silenes-dioicae]